MQVNTRIYAPATDRDLERSKSVSVKLERGTMPEKGNVREIQISVVTDHDDGRKRKTIIIHTNISRHIFL